MSRTNNSWIRGHSRRDLLRFMAAASATPALSACGGRLFRGSPSGRVVVIGGGFGGATAAKYIKRGDPSIDVTLVEPKKTFYTCPFSNLVLAGERSLDSIGHKYRELKEVYGVKVVHAMAEDVDADARKVRLAGGETLEYDRLLLSPGIDIHWDELEGYGKEAAKHAPHAWEAGDQTLLLRRQLEAMDDGGLFIITAPADPFRCPPGPYERASLVAHYFSQHKPSSKVMILDAKDNFSKQGLFQQGWQEVHGDRVEWIGRSDDGEVTRVDAQAGEVETAFGTRHSADVLNVVPPQKAGFIAGRAGVTDESGWVPIKPETFESQKVPDIYVVGDATVASPMPKSGFAANTQGKVAAAAIVASLTGRQPTAPSWANTCYSLIDPEYGISVAGVYDIEDDEIIATSSGLSPMEASTSHRRMEAEYAVGWYNAISQDTWGTRL